MVATLGELTTMRDRRRARRQRAAAPRRAADRARTSAPTRAPPAGRLAPVAREHELVISHGNGPQVGLLALQSSAYKEVEAYPFDVLGCADRGHDRLPASSRSSATCCRSSERLATLLTHDRGRPGRPRVRRPDQADRPGLHRGRGGGAGRREGLGRSSRTATSMRRVVPSPLPRRIFGIEPIEWLLEHDCVVICAGRRRHPRHVHRRPGPAGRRLVGVEAVIDKDRASALLATAWRRPAGHRHRRRRRVHATGARREQRGDPPRAARTPSRRLEFAAGSMGPKVQRRVLVRRADRRAGRDRLDRAHWPACSRGEAGTVVVRDADRARAGGNALMAATDLRAHRGDAAAPRVRGQARRTGSRSISRRFVARSDVDAARGLSEAEAPSRLSAARAEPDHGEKPPSVWQVALRAAARPDEHHADRGRRGQPAHRRGVDGAASSRLLILLNVVLGTRQELKARASVDALSKMQVPQSRVVRDGHVMPVPGRATSCPATSCRSRPATSCRPTAASCARRRWRRRRPRSPARARRSPRTPRPLAGDDVALGDRIEHALPEHLGHARHRDDGRHGDRHGDRDGPDRDDAHLGQAHPLAAAEGARLADQGARRSSPGPRSRSSSSSACCAACRSTTCCCSAPRWRSRRSRPACRRSSQGCSSLGRQAARRGARPSSRT